MNTTDPRRSARGMPVTAACRSSPTNRRRRRTKAEIEALRDHIYEVARADHPVSIRQVFYRLVSLGVIEKSEGEYSATVGRLCVEMRKSGDLPWDWVADNTRWMRKPETFDSLEDALDVTARTYRRSLWTTSNGYVEVWLEKEALSGVLYPVTEAWDVSLMVTRGYPSLTFLHAAAEAFPHDRPTFIYYFGDHDPSGIDISRHTEAQLREFYTRHLLDAGPDGESDADLGSRLLRAGLRFERVAVTPQQIEEMQLPTRPTKRTDSRAKGWDGGSVEVDAIPPATLRRICEELIVAHVDERELAVLRETEALEREALQALAARGARP